MVIGLTGNIGSGKSTVAEVFANLGATVIDGDVLGREVTEEEPEYRDWLRQRFGEEIWQGETLDRAALGRIVFADGGKRDELNTAIWPYIRKRLADRIRTVLEQDGIPVVDAAMIFEWGDQDRYDALVAVVVDPEVGAERAAARLGITFDEAMARYKMQVPVGTKAKKANYVIINDGPIEQLRDEAISLWKRLQAKM